MTDILAIVSKAVFDKDAQQGGRRLGVGDVLPTDRYLSRNRALEPLAGGGRLFLATVRPPDERLWLVAILEGPVSRDGAWIAPAPNRVPITDITPLRATLRFESGKGMSQDKGALGMSLQTPRALAASDVAQILAAAAPPAPRPRKLSVACLQLLAAVATSPGDDALRERAARRLMAESTWDDAMAVLAGYARLNAHDPPADGAAGLPCLCRACIDPATKEATAGGMVFERDFVVAARRVLFFWAPREVCANARGLRSSVRGSLAARTALLDKRRKRQARPSF